MNKLLTKRILAAIPKSIRPRDYLMEKLEISKESAYRRMRNEISFSLEEAVIISSDLGFSLDGIVEQIIGKEALPGKECSASQQAQESFVRMLSEYNGYLEAVSEARKREVWMSARQLNLFFLAEYETLLRLFYYNRIVRTFPSLASRPFSKITLTPEMQALRKQIGRKTAELQPVELFLDRQLFAGFAQEVVYYHRLKLITDDELTRIRRELNMLLDRLERLMKQDAGSAKESRRFYLSLIDIECNSVYAAYDHRQLSLYQLNPLKTTIEKNNTDGVHKKWLESLKKHSTLIGGSNELVLAEFIEEQRKRVKN
jgi:hypothetical protein